MNTVILFTLVASFLLAIEARVDNKFAGEHHRKQQQQQQQGRWPARPEPVLDISKEPEEGNEVEVDFVKVKGHHNRGTGRGHYGYRANSEAKAYVEKPHHGNVHHGRQNKLNDDGSKKEVVSKWKGRTSTKEDKGSTDRKTWKKISNYKHEESKQCSQMKCKRKHVCLVNGETGVAECVPKRILRQSRKFERSEKGLTGKKKDVMKKHAKLNKVMPDKTVTKKHIGPKKMAAKQDFIAQHKRAHRMARKIKNKAEKFQNKFQEKKRHHLHHLKDVSEQKKSSDISHVNALPLKPSHTQLKYCSQKDLEVMGKRLLDWFKVLQDQSERPHVIQKRNSKKKELHEQDECICQAPVRSEFLRLDRNHDDVLSVKELSTLETNGYEHCIKPFIDSCDHDKDGTLSDREWCCCFADVLPPCLAEMKKVPATLTGGEPIVVPGAFVPQCDSDGFYKPVQCHGSTGYCWCVDRNGVTIEGTHTRGMPDCEEDGKTDESDKTVLEDLE